MSIHICIFMTFFTCVCILVKTISFFNKQYVIVMKYTTSIIYYIRFNVSNKKGFFSLIFVKIMIISKIPNTFIQTKNSGISFSQIENLHAIDQYYTKYIRKWLCAKIITLFRSGLQVVLPFVYIAIAQVILVYCYTSL